MTDHTGNKTDDHTEMSGDRSFGIVFTVVFLLLAVLAYVKDMDSYVIPAGSIAGAFLLVALVAPRLLRPLNVVWFKFGALLHKIISPIILGLLFFALVTPIALIMRAMGKDLLKLRLDPDAKSYWAYRDPPGPVAPSLSDQF